MRWVALAAVAAGLALTACSSPTPAADPTGLSGSTASSGAPAPSASLSSTATGEPAGPTEYCDRLKTVPKAIKDIEKDNTNVKAAQTYSDAFLSAAEIAPNDLAVWMTALAEITGPPSPEKNEPTAETFDFVFMEAPRHFQQIKDTCGFDVQMGGPKG